MPESAFAAWDCLNFSGSSLYNTPELGSISPALLTILFVLDAEDAVLGSSGAMKALAELLAAFEELTNNFVFGMLSAKGARAKRWILLAPTPECFAVGLNLLGAGGSGGERDLLRCS